MNRPCMLAAAVLSFAALCGCDESASKSAPAATTTLAVKSGSVLIQREIRPSILIEAEAGEIKAPVKVVEDKDASGGKYCIAPEGPKHEQLSVGGDVTYRFKVDKPGEYFLWVRGHWCCSCGNSVGVALDAVDLKTVEDSTYGKWHWVRLEKKLSELKAGTHLLVLSNREDGAGFDQVLLTQDPDYRPTEIELLDIPGRTSGLAQDGPAKQP